MTEPDPAHSAARDLVQHHIVAALAQADDPRLVFKGGTMLRVCALPDYRFSEDLDFDWRGAANGFQAAMAGASLWVSVIGRRTRPNPVTTK